MPTFHIQGFAIVHYVHGTKASLRALMVNASAVGKGGMIPSHSPRLIVAQSSVVESKVSSLKASTRRGIGVSEPTVEFDLSSTTGLRIDVRSTDPLRAPVDHSTSEHPDPVTPDWTSLHWVCDTARLIPGATLKPEYQDLGKKLGKKNKINVVVNFLGGTLHGEDPASAGGDYVWSLSPTFKQAVTDKVACTSSSGETSIVISANDGPQVANIVVKGDADVLFTNDPPPSQLVQQRTKPEMPHLKPLLKDAFDDHDTKSIAKVDPKPQQRWFPKRLNGFYEVGYCITLLVFEKGQRAADKK